MGVGSFEGMGIVGAAITNNLRIVVMFFIGLHLLFGKNGALADYSSKKMPFDFKAFKELIIFGVPTSIGNSFWNFAALFLSNFILSYGESYFAAYQLGLQCEGFCDMMASGFLTAAASLSGKAIGSNDEIAYKKSYERLRHYCLIIMCITMLFLAVLSRTVLCMLTDKEEFYGSCISSADDSVSVPGTNDKNTRWFYTFCRTQLNSDSYRYDWYIGSQSVFMLFSK